MRIEDLSVNERIMIHLKDFSTDPVADGASLGQTQEGIGEGVGIRINHVPRATNSLLKDGYIDEALVHIGGLKRKRKAFFLTSKGLEASDSLISSLRLQKVPFRDSGGGEELVTIQDIAFKTRAMSAPTLILTAFKDGVILEDSLSGAKGCAFVSMLDLVSLPDHFVDRERERDILESVLEAGVGIVIVSGIKGIGKTSLVRITMERFKGRKNIFWYAAHDWDTARSFMEQVSDMYVRLGRNELKKALRQTKDVDVSQAAAALARDMKDSDSVLVVDNVFDLGKEMMQIIHLLCEQAGSMHKSCLVLITRDREQLVCATSGTMTKKTEITIGGLDRNSAMEMMATLGLEPEDSDRVFAMTQGHPLAIKLVNSEEIMKVIDTKGLTKEEVWVVRCMKAFNAIFD